MASHINDFGSVSNGLDRAQLDVGPHSDKSTDPRPPPEALDYHKPSIRRAVKVNFLSAIVHPRYGINKIKSAINEKHEASSSQPHEHHHDHAPTLAPPPPVGSVEDERLKHRFKEKPKFPPVKEFIRQPVASVISTIQDQRGSDFAESVAKSEISHGADVQLLHQSEKVDEASNESERDAEHETFVQMKQLRQDAFVRWTIDRHVRIVGRIQVSDTPPTRPPSFASASTDGKQVSWTGYGKELLKHQLEIHAQYYINPEIDMPMLDRKLLASTLERVIIASTPLQTLVMKLRSISHWEDPLESAGYMTLYFLLLLYSYITSMVILFILFKVLHRGWHPPTLDSLRDTVIHSENQDVTAQNLGELVTQYGTRRWVDHAIEKAGPAIFDCLERMADVLEMIRNFHQWRNPWYTGITLCSLFAWWLLITLTPTWLLVQMSFCSMGVVFFILTPLSVRYPRYRLLLDPWTWFLWRSPTHAEWAIHRLQAEAQQYLSEDKKLKTVDKDTHLIGSYTCNSNSTSGRLIVLATSVVFSPKNSHSHSQSADKPDSNAEPAAWCFLFNELKEIHKITEQTKYGGEDIGLVFVPFQGERQKVMRLARRDEVFSQIVGYSGLEWKKCA